MPELRKANVIETPNHTEEMGLISEMQTKEVMPLSVWEELDRDRQHYDYKNRCVFCDLVQQELAEREGVVEESAQFLGEVKL